MCELLKIAPQCDRRIYKKNWKEIGVTFIATEEGNPGVHLQNVTLYMFIKIGDWKARSVNRLRFIYKLL